MLSRLLNTYSLLRVSLVCLLLFASLQVMAGIFRINEYQEKFLDLNQQLEVLSDSKGDLILDDIRIKKAGFVPFSQVQGKLKSGTTYWGKITIQSQMGRYGEWLLFLGHNSYVDVYVEDAVGFKLKKAGHHYDLYEKEIPTGRGCKVRLEMHAGETKTIYIKYKNDDGYKPKIGLYLQNPEQWRKTIEWRNLTQGAFHGVLLIFFLYNMLLFFLNRDKTYLYYSLYVFFIGVYPFARNNFLREFVIQEGVLLWQSIWIIGAMLYPVFYILFMRRFLDTPKLLPKWDKVFMIAIYLMVSTLAIALFVHFAFFKIKLIADFAILQTLVSNIFLLVILFVIIAKLKNRLSYLFAIGSAFLWISILLGVGILILSNNAEFISLFQIGILGEILLFSLGLGYRMKLNEHEKRKAQTELIEQLKENQELQTKVTRELEEKVAERTYEIEQKREEIEIQRDQMQSTFKIIEKKNKDITASINYAKRIQQAIMPSEGLIRDSIEDFFMIFKPRDIVSGDFYWFAEIEKEGITKKVIAAVDCTGHGVPGAIMSMIGNDLLSESVRLLGISEPHEILNYVNTHLKERLQQESSTTVRDGMDIAICVIDEHKRTVEFAGAKNPVLYIENGEMKEIRGDKFPIGGYKGKVHDGYESHKIELGSEPTWFYLFSDGYQDQFGGENKMKFGKKRLKQTLLENHSKTADEQKAILENELKSWMKKDKQIDDILFLGFKL
ncbi:MAG: serine phosphatase RsbU (regulator of sigma subunit) [Bacteroidia bacterium]